MTNEEKTQAITLLIETGREASTLIDVCANAIGDLLGDPTEGESSKDSIFALPTDPTPREYAQWVLNKIATTQSIAERIASELFTNGRAEVAERLVLQLPNERDGGGWNKAAAIQVIERILKIKGVAE